MFDIAVHRTRSTDEDQNSSVLRRPRPSISECGLLDNEERPGKMERICSWALPPRAISGNGRYWLHLQRSSMEGLWRGFFSRYEVGKLRFDSQSVSESKEPNRKYAKLVIGTSKPIMVGIRGKYKRYVSIRTPTFHTHNSSRANWGLLP